MTEERSPYLDSNETLYNSNGNLNNGMQAPLVSKPFAIELGMGFLVVFVIIILIILYYTFRTKIEGFLGNVTRSDPASDLTVLEDQIAMLNNIQRKNLSGM